jgi:4'-phosphopantetheinyl transferase
MIKLYYLETDLIDKYNIDKLSKYRLNKANRYKSNKDRNLSLAAGLVFNMGLKKLYNLKENEIDIGLLEYGKPYVINHPEINFNISHSNSMSICVFCSTRVGCDIEQVRKFNVDVMNRCYSNKEIEYINKADDKDLGFTRIWLHKEAFLKNLGIGLNDNMKNISIIIDTDCISVKQDLDNNEYVFEERRINDYLISICYLK